MLEFYYDCLRKYLDCNDFQLIQMDRDSFYYAISEEEYNQLQQVYGWFPTNDITLVVIGLPKKTTKSLYENYTL